MRSLALTEIAPLMWVSKGDFVFELGGLLNCSLCSVVIVLNLFPQER